MANNLSDERSLLEEDDAKLQVALQTFNDPWETDSYSDYSDDEEQLLIDLDGASELSGTREQSTSSGFTDTGQVQTTSFRDDESGDAARRPSIGLPSQPDVSSQRTDPEKTLALNRALQGILEENIEFLQMTLKENKTKQEQLEKSMSSDDVMFKSKGTTSGPFRAPYFRTDVAYPSANGDTILKKVSNEPLLTQIKERVGFKAQAREILRQAVLEDCLEQLLKPLMVKMEKEIEKRDKTASALDSLSQNLDGEKQQLQELQEKEKDVHKPHMLLEIRRTIATMEKEVKSLRMESELHANAISQIELELQEKKETPEEELLSTVDVEKVDWMKISKRKFRGRTSWLDCQKAWIHSVVSKGNSIPWNKDEIQKLKVLVAESDNDWKDIAEKLESGRTPFQCFSYYQRNLNSDLKPREWTSEEDKRLINVTEKVKEGVGFNNWRKVSALMNSRSPAECMMRFSQVDPSQARGRWTEEEDVKLMAAVEMLGFKWTKVCRFMGSRNPLQCRERYMNCLSPGINFTHFTYDEDVMLIRLHRQMGSAWIKMVPFFKGRIDGMLAQRMKTLERWRSQQEWFDKLAPDAKNLLQGKSLTVRDRKSREHQIKSYFSHRLGVCSDDYRRQAMDIKNGVDPALIPPRPPFHLKYTRMANMRVSRGIKSWANRLEMHRNMTEHLSCILARNNLENAKRNGNRSKGPARLADEVLEDVLQETVSKTTENPISVTQKQLRQMQAILNKEFLFGAGSLSMLKLIKDTKATPQKKGAILNNTLKTELTSFLRRKRRHFKNLGRVRKCFTTDLRPAKVIEEETNEMKLSVPLMLIKRLGSDVCHLYDMAQRRKLAAEECQIGKFSVVEEQAKDELERFERAIQKVDSSDLPEKTRVQKRLVLEASIRKLHRVIEKEKLNRIKLIEDKLYGYSNDIEFLQSLVRTQKPHNASEVPGVDIISSDGIVVCKGQFTADNFLRHSTFLSTNHETSSLSPTLTSSMPSAPTSASSAITSTSSAIIRSSTVGHTNPTAPEGSKMDDKFAQPTSRLAGRSRTLRAKRSASEGQMSDAPPVKRLRTKEEIYLEKQKIPFKKKVASSSLPLLPPCRKTTNALRTLLLMRMTLILRAGQLYQSKRYERKKSIQIQMVIEDTQEGDESAAEGTINRDSAYSVIKSSEDDGKDVEEDLDVDSSQWFLQGGLENLSHEAKKFDSFRSQSFHPVFDSLVRPALQKLRRTRSKALSLNVENPDTAFNPIAPKNKDVTSGSSSGYDIVFGPVTASAHFGKFISDRPLSLVGHTKRLEERTRDSPATNVEHNSIQGLQNVRTGTGPVNTAAGKGKELRVECPLVVTNINKNRTPEPTNQVCSESTKHRLAAKVVKNLNNCEVIEISAAVSPDQNISPELLDKAVDADNADPSCLPPPSREIEDMQKRLKFGKKWDSVVLVGLDKKSENIVHYKSEDQAQVTAFETVKMEPPSNEGANQVRDSEVDESTVDYMATIRQTEEYKLLLARFRSLFMWPAVLSTVRPTVQTPGVEEEKEATPKVSYSKRKIGKVRAANLKAYWSKKKEKDGESGVSKKVPKDEPKIPGKGRPKGAKNKVHVKVGRTLREKKPSAAVAIPKRRSRVSQSKPKWLKDAMVEAMVSKRVLEETGQVDVEVDIAEDNDFINHGNYSEDEMVSEVQATPGDSSII